MVDNSIKQKIIIDFGLDGLSREQQEESLLTIGRILFQSVIITVLSALSEKDKDQFEELLSRKNVNEKMILRFLRSNLPIEKIVTEEVDKIKKVLKQPKESYLDKLDVEIETLKDIVSEITKMGIIPDIAILFAGLAYDSSRKDLTAWGWQRQFVKRFVSWFGGLMGVLWVSIIMFVIAFYLKQKGTISAIPGSIDVYVPNWFKKFEFTTQLLLTLAIPIGAFLIVVVVVILFREGFLKGILDFLYQKGGLQLQFLIDWLRRKIRRKVGVAEKVTYRILQNQNSLKEIGYSSLSDEGKRKQILDISRIIYQGIFVEHAKDKYQYKEYAEKLKELLSRLDNDEEAVVRFLKPKISNYEKAVSEEISKLCERIRRFINNVKDDARNCN